MSGALHALLFALAGWGARGGSERVGPRSPQLVTRAYAVHYLNLTLVRPPSRAESRPERRPATPPAPVAAVVVPVVPPPITTLADSGVRSDPRRSSLQIKALAPGSVAGIAKIIPTPGSDAGGPGPGTAGPPRRGLDRVAELVDGAGSACPEFPRPAAGATVQAAVAVAFVVDTNGRVDPETLQVVESSAGPQTAHRFHAHIYVVGAKVRGNGDRVGPAAYDFELTRHVAGLVFRPALRQGQAIRSTVLVSCRMS